MLLAGNANESRAFLKTRALWIKMHNDGDERVTTTSKMTEAHKAILRNEFAEYLTQKTDQQEFKGPGWDFVERALG